MGWKFFDSDGKLQVATAAAGAGEANTASNVGVGGVGVFLQKTGVDLEFKNINAGSGKITVTNDAVNNEIDIDVDESALTLDSIGGILGLAKGGTDADLSATGPGALVQASGGAAITVETLDETRGGTGLTSYSTGDLVYASGADTLATLAAGSQNEALIMGASVPAWSATLTGMTLDDIAQLIANAASELTISTGAITVTQLYHTVDTEADAASDDLDTINGGEQGEIIYLQAAHTGRTVVLKHNTGNIQTPSGDDYSLDSTELIVQLMYDGSNWMLIGAGGAGGAGTVTSVAFTATPAGIFDVSGSPITTSGTITLSMDNQSANTVLSGPTSGGAAEPAFRALVADDIPNLNASKITAGQLLLERGGTESDLSATGPGALVQASAGAAVTVETLDETRGGTAQTTYTTGDILYASAADVLSKLAIGTNGQVLTVAAGIPSWAAAGGGGGLFESIAIIRDEKTDGTDGGTFTSGAWRTRDLNTEVYDLDAIVTISSNQFTPAAADYLCIARAPAFQSEGHRSRLYNATQASSPHIGSGAYGSSGTAAQTDSWVWYVFTANGTDAYELQHRCSSSKATVGLGTDDQMAVGVEVFTEVILLQLA